MYNIIRSVNGNVVYFFFLRVRDDMRTIMSLLSLTANMNVFLCRLLSQHVQLAWTVNCPHSEDLVGVLVKVDLHGVGALGLRPSHPALIIIWGGERRPSYCSFTGFTANICCPVLFKHIVWLHPLN